MAMPRIRFLAAAALTVGVTTTIDLEAPVGVSESSLKAALAGDITAPGDARLDGALRFRAETVDMQQPRAVSPILDTWFRRDMSRGWQALGGLGAAGVDGRRSCWFTRRHPGLSIDWPLSCTARPAPCRDGEAVACFEASTDGGEVRIEYGGRQRFVRVRPYAHVSIYERDGGFSSDIRFVGMVRHGDAARLMTIDTDRKWGSVLGFMEQALLRPDIDHDGDGVGDHWRVSGTSRARVTAM